MGFNINPADWTPFILCFSVILCQMGFNINPANWTPFILSQPLIHTLNMEQVHTRKSSHVFFCLKFRKANSAFVCLFFLFIILRASRLCSLRELMWESISLNTRPTCPSVHSSTSSSIHETHVFL